jgi:hypothetical protein
MTLDASRNSTAPVMHTTRNRQPSLFTSNGSQPGASQVRNESTVLPLAPPVRSLNWLILAMLGKAIAKASVTSAR